MLNSSSNSDRSTVDRAISQAQGYLTQFASSKDLSERINLVFGNEVNSQALGELIEAWQVQNFSTIPNIEILSNLGSFKAAYSTQTNIIYLSQEFLNRNTNSSQNVTDVLLEEIGAFLDARINRIDTSGDEGELFSRVVRSLTTSDTQLVQLRAEDDNSTITLQDGSQVNVEQAGIYTGTNLKTELQNAIPNLLDKVKNFINTNVLQGLPLLGNQLGIANPLDALFNGFKTQILSKLAIAPNTDPVAEAKQALLDVLSGALNLLQDSNGDKVIDIADIDAIEGSDSVTFKLKLGQSVKTSVNLNEDIGLPALGLKLTGGVTPELAFNWNLEFGVDKNTGFFVNTGGAAPELSLKLKTELVDSLGTALALKGSLGFLQVDAKDRGSLLQGDFSVDLQNSLASLSVVPKFVGKADLKLGLDASFGGSSKLPKIGADFNLNWDFAAGTSDSKTAGIYAGGLPSVAFDNVRLDVGSFFKDFADPVFGTLNSVLGPIRPLLNIIDGRLPVIDDLGKSFLDRTGDKKVSLVDLALLQNPESATLGFIKALIEVDKVTQSITDLSGDGSIPLTVGSFNLGGSDVRNSGFKLSTLDLGSSSAIAKTADQILGELGGLEINGKQANTFTDLISAASGGGGTSTLPQFPILTDPNQVFKLLLGQDAEFFKYTLPELSFKKGFDEFFRLFGLFGVTFKGDFSARVQVAVGYDSTGIKQFVADGAKDPSKIFNGFFIDNAPDVNGPAGRKSGGEVKASIEAGGGVDVVLARASINGEVASNLNVLLNDPNKDNKVYFNEFDSDCVFDPVAGKITAGLNFSVKVGIGPFSVKKKFDIAKVTLLDFALGCNSGQKAQIAKNGILATTFPDRTLSLNIGTTAASRIINGIAGVDDDESFTVNYKSGTPDDATLIVGYSDITKEYANVKKIVANGGNKGDAIAISDQVFTPAELTGGNEGADELGDQLFGGSGNDIIKGEDGNDSLYGGAGNDILEGGNGDDLLNGGLGADFLDGGDGFDTVSYRTSAVGVTINNIGGALVGSTGDATGDRLVNIEQIEGSNFRDIIEGDGLDNVIEGFDGNDILRGGAGNDVLIGGLGGDTLDGGDGDLDFTSYYTSLDPVTVNLATGKASGGEANGDILISIENVGGSASGDNLTGSAAKNYIDGFFGDDKIQGGGGADTLDGGEGNDTAIYKDSPAAVNVSLLTGKGTGGDAQGDELVLKYRVISTIPLLIITNNSFENLIGSRFNDTLEGDIGDNKLEGLAGNDILRGGDGNDILIGGAGADFFDGGLGVDTADYSSSRSAVSVNFQGTGSGGDALGDTFIKQFGFFGNSTVENLIGSKFGDTLIADGGFNKISPGLSRGGTDTVNGGGTVDDIDTLDVDYSQGDTGTGMTGGYNLNSTSIGSFSRLTNVGGVTLDRIQFSNIEKLIVKGTSKNDTIFGGANDDIIITGDGDDVIYGGRGNNQILAGAGNDIVFEQNRSGLSLDNNSNSSDRPFASNINGGAGIDTLSIDLSGQRILGNISLVSLDPTVENPNQFLSLKNGTAISNFEIFKDINTGFGNDTLIQLGRVDNKFNTNSGNDVVNPGLGIDIVDGGGGDDLLIIDYSVGDIGTGIISEFIPRRIFRNNLDGSLLDKVTIFSFQRLNITGTSKSDQIVGGDGNDILIGNGGNDTIIGNDGNDDISGGDGNDTLIAGSGDDLIDGGNGNDNISDSGFAFNVNIIFTVGGGNDTFNGGAGNDFIVGGQGNDILNGGADNDVLIGIDLNENQSQVAGRDINQVDTLTGGTGADEFWLGDSTSVYYDDAQIFTTGRTNYGLITDFKPSENDVIQLNGRQANYVAKVVNGNTEIFLKGSSIPSVAVRADELIGIVQGVTDFNLGASYVRYVPTQQRIAASSSNFAFAENVENLDSVQSSALTDGLLEPLISQSTQLDLIPQLSLLSDDIAPLSSDISQISLLAPSLILPTDFEIIQNGDGEALLTKFLGTTTGLSNFNVNLKGSSQAFGTFTNDPFGLGSGIVLSTGKVVDLVGKNTVDGGLSSGTNTKLKFTKLPGEINSSGVFRADVSNLGFDLKSLTFADSGSLFGGSPGRATGFDLDAIRLSNQLVTTAADINLATPINVFDFSPVGTILTAGSQRIPLDVPFTDLQGTVNGYINNGTANLAEFDYKGGGGIGSVSLGDNGRVGFNLTSPVSTNQPLYLYVGEADNNGETPDGLISASNRDVNSLSDLSTDFGIPGVTDDSISMEVEFDADASTTNVFFQFAFGSEELLEFAGKFNDAFSLELNGINLAALSNGDEVTINNLANNPVGPYSPDLIYNPASAPVTTQTKLDGFTKTLTFVGEVIPNSANKLEINVRDNRDGLLDSAVFLKAGSFGVVPFSSNTAPTITSAATASFAEKGKNTAYTITATDPDVGNIITYSISGTDSALFTVDANSGAVKFKNVPDFELPSDAGANNVYDFVAIASDGLLSTSLAVAITVTDVSELNGTGTRDPLTGTSGNDHITGGTGAKLVTGGLGNDQFEFNTEREIGQRITDFTLGEDKIVLTNLLASIGYGGTNPISDNFIRFVQNFGVDGGSFLQLDRDGVSGSAIFRNFVQVDNISPSALNSVNNFIF